VDGRDREPEADGTVGMVGGGAGARVNAAGSGSGAPRAGAIPREGWLVARTPLVAPRAYRTGDETTGGLEPGVRSERCAVDKLPVTRAHVPSYANLPSNEASLDHNSLELSRPATIERDETERSGLRRRGRRSSSPPMAHGASRGGGERWPLASRW
jgi:hypothetical protein